MQQAIIKKILQGKMVGQFRFNLKAENGEVIATSENYKAKQSVIKTLKKYFPAFEIVDTTIKK
ncbi:MAG: DUF1508 domain-containing protein [Sphingobacteriales bacterium]|nr:MAG: DUF1508 domain-containing protein [Sphingobacteriales bacterium]